MRVAIIGLGFVGLSLASVLASKGVSVIGIDSDKEKLSSISKGISPIFEPKLEKTLKSALKNSLVFSDNIEYSLKNSTLIFVTVGTPLTKSGKIDLSMIKDVSKKIGKALKNISSFKVVIIKSTVIPGTTQKIVKNILEKESGKKSGKDFGLVTNPEFLREGTVIHDTVNPHMIVIGGNDSKSVSLVTKFYEKFYKQKIPFIKTNPNSAELIKYANNTFLATKISFINQISNICQNLPDTNIEDIAKAIGLDPRIGSQFLKAGPGFGGSCLPKDLKSIISFSSEIGADPILLKAVEKTNLIQVDKVMKLIFETLKTIKNKQITILGLSFKENSDDIRESVSLKLIELLLEKKAKIIAHDPKAINNTKKIFGERISYSTSLIDSFTNSDCVIIMTSWKEYFMISNKHCNKMKQRNLIDTRRILDGKKLNVNYKAIGNGT